MSATRVSVIGLGKLGASMAAALASRGFHVIGADVNPAAVAAVNDGRAPVYETDLEATIAANRDRLRATEDTTEAVLGSDVSFVIVPTPSDERGAFSVRLAAQAFQAIGRALAQKDGYHLVVLTSTVLPGATRYALLPILERESRKAAGRDFGLCYSPEFIALGSVIHDFLNPDFTLIGELDSRSGDTLAACYERTMLNRPPVARMTIENAELTKIALNSYITMKISFANMLADLCEQIPGGDVDVVSNALGLDSRIGSRYLKGALGFGGPCFPRDNVALAFLARELNVVAKLSETTHEFNRARASRLVERLEHHLYPGVTVAVLGLAYKPNTHVIEESPGIALAKELVEAGCNVVVYDPLAMEEAKRELGDSVTYADSVQACVQRARVVAVTVPDHTYAGLADTERATLDDKLTIVDCWRLLGTQVGEHPEIDYLPIGRCTNEGAAATHLRNVWEAASDLQPA
jgi:UDPglucose 6-dehydrogenase